MRTCSFYGTKTVITDSFYRELVRIIYEMTAKEPVDFLFFANNPFQFACLAAALEVRQRRKDWVHLTLLSWADRPFWKPSEIYMPMAVFDDVVPVRTAGKYDPRKVEQVMLRRSDFVVLGQQSEALPAEGPRTCWIHLGDPEHPCQPAGPVACTVLLPGPGGGPVERREALTEMVDFMIRGLGVTHFLFEQLQSYSPYTRAIQKLTLSQRAQCVVVTHLPEEADQDRVRAQFVPPFDDVLNLDPQADGVRTKYIRTVKAMLERSHYVLCDQNTLQQVMAQRFEKYRHLKVLDMGNVPLVREFLTVP